MATAQQYCLRWNNHRSNLLTVFDELLQNEAFTDVTLACDGGVPIKCHRMVLAACSPYFQNLFTDLPCKHPVVVLKDVKYVEIKAILEYMYRGEVNVAQDQLAALLKVAEALKVKGLVEENHYNQHERSKKYMEDDLNHSPSISTSNNSVMQVHSSSNNSPPHSTSALYKNPYSALYGSGGASMASGNGKDHRGVLPMWAMPGIPPPMNPHSSGNDNRTSSSSSSVSVNQSMAANAAAAMLSSCYEAAAAAAAVTSDMSPLKRKKLSSLLMNRDTPILRTVLGQGQADSSQPVSLVCNPDSNNERQRENSSNGSSEERIKHLKNEPNEDAQSPYTDFTMSMSEDDDSKSKMAIPSTSPQSFAHHPQRHHYLHHDMRNASAGIAQYVSAQQNITYDPHRRYKKYTREEIMSAIEAVRNGESALQASKKFGVPSRTLYDKVKKMGITTNRAFRRGSNGSSPYGGRRRSPFDLGDDPMNNNSAALLEATTFLQHALDGRGGDEREALAAMAAAAVAHAESANARRSPSPHQKYVEASLSPSPPIASAAPGSETNGSSERDIVDRPEEEEDEDMEDQVEDLSVSTGRARENAATAAALAAQQTKQEATRVIMPPMNQVSTIIKKEPTFTEGAVKDVIGSMREVSVDADGATAK